MWAPTMPCGARAGAKRPKYEMRRMPRRKSRWAAFLRPLRQRAQQRLRCVRFRECARRKVLRRLRRLLALARETQLGLAVPAIEQALAEA